MKSTFRLLCAAMMFPAVLVLAETRGFTESATGRVITAEVVSATADSVTLKLTTGATHVLPLARLSEADRTHVAGWLKANPTAASAPAAAVAPVRYAFNVTWQKEKAGAKKVNMFPYAGEEEQWVCKFKVSNLSNAPLEDVEARYQIFLSLERDGKVDIDERADGSMKIAALPRNQPVEVSAKSVPLLKVKLDGGYITTDNSRPTKRDSIKGVALGLYHKGVLVHEFRTPGIPKAPFDGSQTPKAAKSPSSN